MNGYLTGYRYGNLINATSLELIRGCDWVSPEFQSELTDRPSWV